MLTKLKNLKNDEKYIFFLMPINICNLIIIFFDSENMKWKKKKNIHINEGKNREAEKKKEINK